METLPSRRTVLSAALLVPVGAVLGPAALARAAAGVGAVAAGGVTDWAQYRHDAARTAASVETKLTTGNVPSLVRVRQVDEGFGLGELTTGGAIGYFKAASTRVQAVNVPKLGNAWRLRTAAKSSDVMPPAVVGGVVFAATQRSATVVALNAKTGTKVWSKVPHPGDDVQAAVAVDSGLVYVAYRGGSLYCLSATNGATRWSVAAVHNTSVGDLWSSPAVAQGVVYVAAEVLAAFNGATGKPVFSTALPLSGDYSLQPPAVAGGQVFVPSSSGLSAFNATTGGVQWSHPIGNCAPVAVVSGTVFAAAGGKLTAYNTATGTIRWSVSLGDSTDGAPGATYANGVVFVASQATYRAFNAANGDPLWTGTPPSGSFAEGLTVSNGVVYTADSGGALTSYQLP